MTRKEHEPQNYVECHTCEIEFDPADLHNGQCHECYLEAIDNAPGNPDDEPSHERFD